MTKEELDRMTQLENKVDSLSELLGEARHELSLLTSRCDHLYENGASAVFKDSVNSRVRCKLCNRLWTKD